MSPTASRAPNCSRAGLIESPTASPRTAARKTDPHPETRPGPPKRPAGLLEASGIPRDHRHDQPLSVQRLDDRQDRDDRVDDEDREHHNRIGTGEKRNENTNDRCDDP